MGAVGDPGVTIPIVPPHHDADAIVAAVDMAAAVEVLRAAFGRRRSIPPRTQVELGRGDDLLLMPAYDDRAIGIKTVTVIGDNPSRGLPLVHAHYSLFDRQTGRPLASFDGTALTALRTPAASALATDVLAPPDPATLGVFGIGVQARGHIEAMLAVRPSLAEVRVTHPDRDRAAVFARDMARRHNRPVAVADPGATSACDIVCGCTSSIEPVVDTEAVRPGAHLNLVGSYSDARREVDEALVARSRVFVDDRDAARAEAGELIAAAARGPWSFDRIEGDLVDLVSAATVDRAADDITLFKSVGLALEDLAVALAVVERGAVAEGG